MRVPMTNTYGNLRQIWFGGTTAIKKGESFAFVAGSVDAVEKLTPANAEYFAGVSTGSRGANANGQSVTLAMPGNMDAECIILGNHAAGAVVSALVTAGAGNGYFAFAGKNGAGSAILNEAATATLQNGLDNSWTVDSTGLIVTMTVAAGIVAGDKLLAIISEDGDVVPGEYTIESIASERTSVTLIEALGNSAGCNLTGVIYKVPPLVRCRLLNGTPTGLVQLAVGTEDITPTGKTLFVGGYTPAADIAVEIPLGESKTYGLTDDLTTYDIVLTPASANTLASYSGTLVSIAIDTAAAMVKMTSSVLASYVTAQMGATEAT